MAEYLVGCDVTPVSTGVYEVVYGGLKLVCRYLRAGLGVEIVGGAFKTQVKCSKPCLYHELRDFGGYEFCVEGVWGVEID